jgi:hypothetical protein
LRSIQKNKKTIIIKNIWFLELLCFIIYKIEDYLNVNLSHEEQLILHKKYKSLYLHNKLFYSNLKNNVKQIFAL